MNDVEVQSVQSKFLYTDPIINRLEGNICLVNVTTTTTILEDGSKIITHNCHIYRATLMP